MKIYDVTFNDGGWYSAGGRPSFQVVAENKQEAIDKVLEEHPSYKSGYDVWAGEFKIKGYVIEVYDKKAYKRNKKLDKLV
jgi:hypothetical protein